jgi:hypothetical protein
MTSDSGRGAESFGVRALAGLADGVIHATTTWRIDRYDAEQTAWVQQRSGRSAPQGHDFARLGVDPYLTTEETGNAILQAGWARVLANLTAVPAATAVYDATHTRIGAGNGVTAINAVTDTDLSAAAGSANRWFQLVSGAPTIGGTIPKTAAWSASFGTADGNFAWNEFGIDNGTASGNTVTAPLLNRALLTTSTKASGQTWVATATLSMT